MWILQIVLFYIFKLDFFFKKWTMSYKFSAICDFQNVASMLLLYYDYYMFPPFKYYIRNTHTHTYVYFLRRPMWVLKTMAFATKFIQEFPYANLLDWHYQSLTDKFGSLTLMGIHFFDVIIQNMIKMCQLSVIISPGNRK